VYFSASFASIGDVKRTIDNEEYRAQIKKVFLSLSFLCLAYIRHLRPAAAAAGNHALPVLLPTNTLLIYIHLSTELLSAYKKINEYGN
jgi:hypothetical protein